MKPGAGTSFQCSVIQFSGKAAARQAEFSVFGDSVFGEKGCRQAKSISYSG